MIWLFWNIRGLNKRHKQKEVKQFLLNKRIRLAGIVETRVKEHNMTKILQAIAPGWDIHSNYQDAINGRIWLLWDPNCYDITLHHKSSQLIHCLVRDRSNDQQLLVTVIYAFNTIDQRKPLWQDLKQLSQGITYPWVIAPRLL
ncbi:hypothetical protein KY284_012675 [Solanum tuberosum]|nr:hypothetical protein KY284_012675 [Solanum tuberosum]